jgi:hypothetical protein
MSVISNVGYYGREYGVWAGARALLTGIAFAIISKFATAIGCLLTITCNCPYVKPQYDAHSRIAIAKPQVQASLCTLHLSNSTKILINVE